MSTPTVSPAAVSPAELVRHFHEVYALPVRTQPDMAVPEHQLRIKLIEEEYIELRDAVRDGDLVETADALADLIYVIYGYALVLGVDLDDVLTEVQRSNLSKLGADGLPIYHTEGPKRGKVMKGPNFSEPDIRQVLERQGWTGERVPQTLEAPLVHD